MISVARVDVHWFVLGPDGNTEKGIMYPPGSLTETGNHWRPRCAMCLCGLHGEIPYRLRTGGEAFQGCLSIVREMWPGTPAGILSVQEAAAIPSRLAAALTNIRIVDQSN